MNPENWQLEASDQRLELLQRFRVDAVTDFGPVDFALHESGLLQNLQVLRNRRLGQRQLVNNFAADTALATDQHTHDAHSGRMGYSPR